MDTKIIASEICENRMGKTVWRWPTRVAISPRDARNRRQSTDSKMDFRECIDDDIRTIQIGVLDIRIALDPAFIPDARVDHRLLEPDQNPRGALA